MQKYFHTIIISIQKPSINFNTKIISIQGRATYVVKGDRMGVHLPLTECHTTHYRINTSVNWGSATRRVWGERSEG